MFLSSITLAPYFSFQFSTRAMRLPQTIDVFYNLLDLVDQSGQSLFAFYVASDASLRIYYNGAQISFGSLGVESSDPYYFTVLSISVTPGQVSVYSEFGGTEVSAVGATGRTDGQIYKIFVSNAHDGSANAFISDIVIQG